MEVPGRVLMTTGSSPVKFAETSTSGCGRSDQAVERAVVQGWAPTRVTRTQVRSGFVKPVPEFEGCCQSGEEVQISSGSSFPLTGGR